MSTRQHAGTGLPQSDIPEPSLAERARTLVSLARIGTLSTHSQKLPGFPFGSMMPYATADDGSPVFFVSTMAMHTQNMQSNSKVSLLITEPDFSGDPLASARVTLLGQVTKTPAEKVQDLYLARHENANYWKDFTDFAYYQLEIASVYFIGGFGVMGWLAAEDYQSASPDPLAEAAPGIVSHMNSDHADALLLMARHFLTGPATETVEEATMTAVDRLGFHLRLRSGDKIFGRRLPFPREVTNTGEARSVLIEMVRQAR